MARRNQSPQYTSVRRNYVPLTQYLEANKEAKISLTRQYKSEDWLDPVATPSEDELVSQVMVRIKDDPKQYDVFISMLKEIAGTSLIVQKLTGKSMYVCSIDRIIVLVFLLIFMFVYSFSLE